MRKAMLTFLVLSLIVCLLPLQAHAETQGDFQYIITDGKATLTRYTGYGGDVKVPSTLGGYPVTSIGTVFNGCTDLTSISIPEGVTEIELWAFTDCTNLTSVSLPDSITYIGSWAFQCCTSLTDLTIPDGVTYIGEYAFMRCTSLTDLNIPDSVTTIRDEAFRECTGLTTVIIPVGVTAIKMNTFYGCTSLEEIYIPEGVEKIEYDAFKDAPLKTVHYFGTQEQWNNINLVDKASFDTAQIIFTEPETTPSETQDETDPGDEDNTGYIMIIFLSVVLAVGLIFLIICLKNKL